MGSGTKSPQAEVPTPSPTAPGPFSSAIAQSLLRFVLPSLADVIFVTLLLCFALGQLSQKLLSDGDIGWHIRTGQQILAVSSLPRTDPFSSSMNGKPWFAWEWLYDALVGEIYNVSRLNGVVAASALLIAITFLIAFRTMLRDGDNHLAALALVLLAVSASMIHALARPHLITWLFVVVWLAVLDGEQSNQGSTDYRLYWLPVLMSLWVNLHGGFLLGFVLLGIYLLAAIVNLMRSASPPARLSALSRMRSLAGVSVLSAIASLVNPYGYRLHLHIYQYLSNRFLMTHINEFKSPDFHGVAERCFLILLAITALAVATSWKKIAVSHYLLLMFAAYAGLRASRNIPIASLLLAILAAPILSDLLQRISRAPATSPESLAFRLQTFSARMAQTQAVLRGHVWPICALLAILGACLNHGALGPCRAMDAHFDPKHFPVQAVDRLTAEQNTQPIFTQDSWGGYLIYRLYQQTKVVVDDRHDFYGEQFLREYLKVLHVEPGWQSTLDGWNVNVDVLPQNSKLTTALKQDSSWQVIESDEVATTFQRIPAHP